VVDHYDGNLVFGLSAAFDAVVVCAALVWATRRRRSPLYLTGVFAAVVVVLAGKGVALVSAGVGVPFGVLHVLWLDLVLVVPLGGAAVL
jgi:heme A synthase